MRTRSWIVLVALSSIALLFYLEHLGSEQPQRVMEISVVAPANVAGTQH
jgi:hypothetical protein